MTDDIERIEPTREAFFRVPARLHPLTQELVEHFAEALAEKLRTAELKYGYGITWSADGWREDCVRRLYEHARKGDPRDVAAFCAFAWYHGWSIADDPEIAALKADIERHLNIISKQEAEIARLRQSADLEVVIDRGIAALADIEERGADGDWQAVADMLPVLRRLRGDD